MGFEFEVVGDIPEFGSQNVLGGGGRYNGLVEQLGGPSIPAVGFAMGLDRTILAMETLGVNFKIRDNIDIFIMYGNEEEKETANSNNEKYNINIYKEKKEVYYDCKI